MRTTQLTTYSKSRDILLTLLGVGLMALMGQISIPLHPVPITFQTVGFLIIGLTFSPRHAASSLAAYIGLGALGAPIFSGFSAGPGVLMGPTAGFFLGFLVVGTLMAWVREKLHLKSPLGLFILSLGGQSLLYVFGVSWLCVTMPLKTAVTVGVVPFLLPGLAKSIITAGLLGYLKKPS